MIKPVIDVVVREVRFVKKHSIAVGLSSGTVLTSLGVIVLTLCDYYLKAEWLYWDQWRKEITREYGHLSGPLVLLAMFCLIIGLFLIVFSLWRWRRGKGI